MKDFLEVITIDDDKQKRRAIIPVNNIAFIVEVDGELRVCLKKGNIHYVTLHQSYDQIANLLR